MRYTSQQLTELVGGIVLRRYLKHDTSRRVEGKEKHLFTKVSTVKASTNMTVSFFSRMWFFSGSQQMIFSSTILMQKTLRYAMSFCHGHFGGQYNRIFSRRIYMKIEFSSQRREIRLFLTTNMATVTSPENRRLLWTRSKLVIIDKSQDFSLMASKLHC